MRTRRNGSLELSSHIISAATEPWVTLTRQVFERIQCSAVALRSRSRSKVRGQYPLVQLYKSICPSQSLLNICNFRQTLVGGDSFLLTCWLELVIMTFLCSKIPFRVAAVWRNGIASDYDSVRSGDCRFDPCLGHYFSSLGQAMGILHFWVIIIYLMNSLIPSQFERT